MATFILSLLTIIPLKIVAASAFSGRTHSGGSYSRSTDGIHRPIRNDGMRGPLGFNRPRRRGITSTSSMDDDGIPSRINSKRADDIKRQAQAQAKAEMEEKEKKKEAAEDGDENSDGSTSIIGKVALIGLVVLVCALVGTIIYKIGRRNSLKKEEDDVGISRKLRIPEIDSTIIDQNTPERIRHDMRFNNT